MPQWFLALWIAARDLVGSSITSISSGISGYVAAASSKALTFLDSGGNQPTDLADDAIVMRTLTTTSLVNPGPTSIVIGAQSGHRTTPSTAGKNIMMGNTAQINASKLDITSATLIGNLVRLDDAASASTAAGNLNVGYGNTTMAGRNVFVGSSLTASYSGTTQRDITYRQAVFGTGITLQHWPTVANASIQGVIAGVNGSVKCQAAIPFSCMDQIGSSSTTAITGGTKADVSMVGSYARLTWAAGCTFGGSGDIPSTLRLAKGAAASYSTTAAFAQSGIDIVTGADLKTSWVILGGGVDSVSSGLGYGNGTNAGNTAHQYAICDWSKQKDTGTVNTTIPDFCSTYIVKGSGTKTITMPANALDGQRMTICVGAAHTAITVAANTGQTLQMGAAMGVSAGSFATWIYDLADLTWYRRG